MQQDFTIGIMIITVILILLIIILVIIITDITMLMIMVIIITLIRIVRIIKLTVLRSRTITMFIINLIMISKTNENSQCNYNNKDHNENGNNYKRRK